MNLVLIQSTSLLLAIRLEHQSFISSHIHACLRHYRLASAIHHGSGPVTPHSERSKRLLLSMMCQTTPLKATASRCLLSSTSLNVWPCNSCIFKALTRPIRCRLQVLQAIFRARSSLVKALNQFRSLINDKILVTYLHIFAKQGHGQITRETIAHSNLVRHYPAADTGSAPSRPLPLDPALPLHPNFTQPSIPIIDHDLGW